MYDNKILGAIVGDIVGSTRKWKNAKTEGFELLPAGSRFTDDTVMTLAVAEWLMIDPTHSKSRLVDCMQRLGRKYPDAGYGGMFRKWIATENPKPYNSFGNGSAMRVSPVGLYANSMEEALELARITASVSHNHPEGIKGAQLLPHASTLNEPRLMTLRTKLNVLQNGTLDMILMSNYGLYVRTTLLIQLVKAVSLLLSWHTCRNHIVPRRLSDWLSRWKVILILSEQWWLQLPQPKNHI